MIDIKALAKTLAGLNIEEILALTAELKETYGLEPPTAQVTTPITKETVIEEKTTFNVIIKEQGPTKLKVIKLWNTLGGINSLMDAKRIIESAPIALKENISKEEAEHIKTELETEGAVISIE